MKTCKQCKQLKEESEFYKDRKSKDGRTSKCKLCILSNIKTKLKNETKLEREKRLDTGKKWRENNTERLLYHREKAKQWHKDNPIRYWAEHALNGKRRDERFTVNMTTDELVEKALKTPCCPLCGKKINYEYKGTGKMQHDSPSIDRIDNENIVTPENTWIICVKCNSAKSDRTLQEFIDYCKKIASFEC